jgi:hypothetical protein
MTFKLFLFSFFYYFDFNTSLFAIVRISFIFVLTFFFHMSYCGFLLANSDVFARKFTALTLSRIRFVVAVVRQTVLRCVAAIC